MNVWLGLGLRCSCQAPRCVMLQLWVRIIQLLLFVFSSKHWSQFVLSCMCFSFSEWCYCFSWPLSCFVHACMRVPVCVCVCVWVSGVCEWVSGVCAGMCEWVVCVCVCARAWCVCVCVRRERERTWIQRTLFYKDCSLGSVRYQSNN